MDHLVRLRLLNTTALQSPPIPDDDQRTGDRIAISKAILGRQPFVLMSPNRTHAVWVEGEPDDWADQLAYADKRLAAEGGLTGDIVRDLRHLGLLEDSGINP